MYNFPGTIEFLGLRAKKNTSGAKNFLRGTEFPKGYRFLEEETEFPTDDKTSSEQQSPRRHKISSKGENFLRTAGFLRTDEKLL